MVSNGSLRRFHRVIKTDYFNQYYNCGIIETEMDDFFATESNHFQQIFSYKKVWENCATFFREPSKENKE